MEGASKGHSLFVYNQVCLLLSNQIAALNGIGGKNS